MSGALRNPMSLAIALIVLLVLGSMTFSIVPETSQGIITSYGQVKRTVNAYRPEQRIGSSGAGLYVRIPFVEQIHWIDKRVRGVEMERQEMLSTDQLRLSVDAYARFRIVNPVRMYTSIRSEDALTDQLRTLLTSALRAELGKRTFASLLSPERGQVMQNIQRQLNREANKYGAEVIDVRIKRAELPEGSPLQSAYERMRTARRQEAAAIDAEGQKDAQIIRAQAEAEAARIYANSYGKDPDFYDFYRSMESYRQTFRTDAKGSTQVIMSPDSEYLRNFGRGQ